jgi:hypothetical protein
MDKPSMDDEQLLAELRSALAGVDAVPESVSEAARAAYAWRTIDAELAALSYDSFLDDKELAGVRSGGEGARMLTFDSADLTVEIAVERGRIIGQLVPPQPGSVEVRHAGGSTTVQADEIGRFACDDVPRGPFSLRCATSSATAIVTDWIVL